MGPKHWGPVTQVPPVQPEDQGARELSMTQICFPQDRERGCRNARGSWGPSIRAGHWGRPGEEVGWKRRAAPETHTFSCRQVGSEEPLVLSDRGETTTQWSFEMVKMVKVKMTVIAGGGSR